MPKKIVLINQVTGYLFVDVANAFAEKYDEVVLMAGDVVPMNIPLNSGIKVQKIFRYNRKSSVKRFFSWISCLVNIAWLLFFKYRNYDLLISSNPPISSTILPMLFKRKINLLIYDIYPDGLVAGNFVTKKNLLFKSWVALNCKSYKKVRHIFTLTPGMAKALEVYASKEKIIVVPAWAGVCRKVSAIPENENIFLKKYCMQGKFIVMYSGNLGKEYELEPLIKLAKIFRNNSNIVFIIMGNGWKKESLEKMIATYDLPNCMLLPYQDADLFAHSLAAFHVGVVALATAAAKVAIPSKTYNLVASHRPIFCIGNEASDLANFLKQNEIGVAIEPDKLEKMTIFIEKLYTDKNYYDTLCSNAEAIAELYTKERAKEIVGLA